MTLAIAWFEEHRVVVAADRRTTLGDGVIADDDSKVWRPLPKLLAAVAGTALITQMIQHNIKWPEFHKRDRLEPWLCKKLVPKLIPLKAAIGDDYDVELLVCDGRDSCIVRPDLSVLKGIVIGCAQDFVRGLLNGTRPHLDHVFRAASKDNAMVSWNYVQLSLPRREE